MKLISNVFGGLKEANKKTKNDVDHSDFLDTCNLIKVQREKCGYSRKDLSVRTKISVAVIESLEKARINQFPERTFLKKMLLILEIELSLPKNRLISILDKSISPKQVNKPRVFTPAHIDLFRTWKGSVAYLLLMIISIFALNKQQQFLLKINSKTIYPFEMPSKSEIKLKTIINETNIDREIN